MYQITTTKQFERDYKLCKKRGYRMILVNTIILQLEKAGSVPAKNKPHKLSGNYNGFRECHNTTRLVADMVSK